MAEIFPGILLIEGVEGPELYISDEKGEIADWAFHDLTPDGWRKCLNVLMQAAKFGPAAARIYLTEISQKSNVSQEDQLKLLCCNICGNKFSFTGEHYNFKTAYNGQSYNDFQCSQMCHAKRIKQVLNQNIKILKILKPQTGEVSS